MTNATPPWVQLEKLIDETRAARRDLHVLVERLRNERTHWERDAAALPTRLRLTAIQRYRFRAHLSTLRIRRVR